MIDLLEERIGDLAGKRVAVLGLAFKDNTDDIRESHSIPIIEKLLIAEALGDADDCLVMTLVAGVYLTQ